MHWLPNFSAASRTNSGRATAAVLIDTLSAPASSNLRMSSTVRTPPPTVSGMKHCSAVRRDDVVERVAPLVARRDIEKTQFVGALAVIKPRLLDRVAGIGQIDKVDPLDDPPVLDVEAGNDAHLQHQARLRRRCSAALGSSLPS